MSTRLSEEQQRLFLTPPAAAAGAPPAPAALVDAQGAVRAMVLELARPADWPPMARVWKAAQTELALPAPAIAVSGRDGYQLWFSLSQPLAAPRARAFLESLCRRYLAELPPGRLTLWPKVDAASPPSAEHAALVPARQPGSGPWSAFVAPDLAPMFADEPWLDLPPNPEGQAQLLAALTSIGAADFELAMEQLQPVLTAPTRAEPPAARDMAPSALAAPAGGWTDPRRFLLDVMNDGQAPLALRIEAAKALLAGPEAPSGT
jgi:hypothetical protein